VGFNQSCAAVETCAIHTRSRVAVGANDVSLVSAFHLWTPLKVQVVFEGGA
jgi:hypothetical protein